MEITIDTIIKVILILVVILVVGASLFLFWNNYLKPYFSGIGKEVAGIAILRLKTKRFKNMNCLKKS
ncbi:hypothetical protein J4433_02885 [Candidatus Pacearchaeota archaeon]|nr:hypothetical protein [Candidatus Pacearchaeota archaeon]